MRKECGAARVALAVSFLVSAIAAAPEGGTGSIGPPILSALPAEAPSSLFNAKLGPGPDDDAELLVSGSWSATVLASLDLQAAPGQSLAFASAQPLLFTQNPDISLSFLLFKKVFVEARVSDDVTQARFAAGYRGGKGELLREARIGNDGISFPTLPFLSFGEGSYRSLGAAAVIASEGFTGRAMLRYDQADRVEKHFIGSTEVTETVLSPNAFISGKYFLTWVPPGSSVVVYVQSTSGTLAGNDGRPYRQLASDEYSYSGITGLIALTSAASTRVLASYTGSGSQPDAVTVAGNLCDLLYDPPYPPPTVSTGAPLVPKLQSLNRYATTASPLSAEAFVRNPSSGQRDQNFEARIDISGFIEVTRIDALDASSGDTSIGGVRDRYRQPFADAADADMPWLYTTDFTSTVQTGVAPVYTRTVVVQSFAPSASITIDKDFVSGSIQVTRNGIPDYSFSVNPDTGILTLAPPPSAAENIDITYMKNSSERKSGNLVGAVGGFWDLGAGENVWTALGASWAVPGTSFASNSVTNPGSIDLTGGEQKTEGPFTHNAAIAARYAQDDATGSYRIEGMEVSAGYSSSFMPDSSYAATAGFTTVELTESGLALAFPKLISSLHADGSVQKALEIIAGTGPGATAKFFTVESTPPYASFKTLSFFAKFSATASLTVTLDDGAAPTPTVSAQIVLPAGAGNGAWRRYILHYGAGDSKIYYQDSEGAPEIFVAAGGQGPSATSLGSRLVIAVAGLATAEQVWVDEVMLQDSVGSYALLFQGQAAYNDPKFRMGPDNWDILSGLRATTDAEGALNTTSFASGGAAVESTLLFVKLGIKARTVVSANASPYFSGGHVLELPAADFPVKLKDEFDFDPSSGAFGRTDTLNISGASIASLSLNQASAWTPAPDVVDSGMIVQSWGGSLALGPSLATIGLTADNRSRPPGTIGPGGAGQDYFSAWIGAFDYTLPAYESSSDLRDAKATLSIKSASAKEFLSASVGESAQPQASGGLRNDTASIRLAVPLAASSVALEPYYSRTWTDTRSASSGGILGDAVQAARDLGTVPILYTSYPFQEFGSAALASDFAAQSSPSGISLAAAAYTPEAGLSLSREYGSKWYDFVAPSAFTFSYGRALVRAADQVTDSGVWSATAKFSSINLFGSQGAYPTGLPFDSDEYLSTLQAKLQQPSDGSTPTFDLEFHGLATLYAGQADKLDTETKVSIADTPSSLDWSSSVMLSLSRRLARHWLLDIYTSLMGPTASASQDGQSPKSSIVSLYLSDLTTREPNMRTTVSLTAGLSGYRSDASAYQTGWDFEESYEAKLTVPERLTFKLDATLDQSLVASTQLLTLGIELGITAIVSF